MQSNQLLSRLAIVLLIGCWPVFQRAAVSQSNQTDTRTNVEDNDAPFGSESEISRWVMPRKGMRIDSGDSSIHLLPVMDPELDSDRGEFKWTDNELVLSEGAQFARLAVPVLAVGSYEWSLTYSTGNDKPELRISFPIDTTGRATVAIGFNDGDGIGIDGYSGKSLEQAGSLVQRECSFQSNKEYKVSIKVEFKSKGRARLQVHVDKDKKFDKTAKRSDFQSTQTLDQHVNHMVPIVLAKSDSEVRFKQINFRKLKGRTIMSRPLAETKRARQGSFGIKFNGSSTNTLSRNFYYDGTYPITFESWVVPYKNKKGLLFSACWKDSYGWLRVSTAEGRWGFHVYEKDSGIRKSAMSNEPIAWGKRTHVAAVFNINQLKLFVDGRHVATSKPFNTFNYAPQGGYLRLGSDMRDKGDHFFSGIVDQFRVTKGIQYSDDFEPEEEFSSREDTLVLYDLDEGQGNLIQDRSGFGFHSAGKNIEWVRID